MQLATDFPEANMWTFLENHAQKSKLLQSHFFATTWKTTQSAEHKGPRNIQDAEFQLKIICLCQIFYADSINKK